MIDLVQDAEFEKWLSQWDAAAEEFAKETVRQQEKPNRTSFFSDSPVDRDYTDQGYEDAPQWAAILNREDDILNDYISATNAALNEGVKVRFGGKPPTKSNPTSFNSVGKDSEVRVTPNFSDGADLRDLDEIKRDLEALERKHHEAEVRGEGGMRPQLDALRSRIEKLSEKINREPEDDMS